MPSRYSGTVLQVVVHERGGKAQRITFTGDSFTVGREDDNDLVLDRPNVSKYHLRLRRHEGSIEVIDLDSTNGTYVNGRRIAEPRVVRRADRVYVGDYIIMLDGDDDAIAPRDRAEIAGVGPDGRPATVPVSVLPGGREAGEPLPSAEEARAAVMTSARRVAAPGSESAYLDKIASRVLQGVLVNVRGLDPYVAAEPSEADRTQAMSIVDGLVQRLLAAGELEEGVDLDGLRGTIGRELLALGPLDELMKDESIVEIHAVGGGPVRLVRRDEERRGRERTVVTDRRFSGDRALTLAIQRLARKWGFLVEGAQVLEGRVSDGFSMYALVPPTAVKTPVLSLRRTRSDASNLQALVQDGVLSKEMRDVLAAAVQGCLRVVVCASGGVNLDRFMQALVGEVPDSLRVLCISDTGRLGATRKGWVQVRRIADATDGVMLSDALGVVMRGGVDMLIAQRCRHEDAAATIDALSGATRGAIVSLWGIDSAHALSRLAALSTVASGAIDALTVALARSVDVLVRLNVGVNGESMQVIELVEPRVKEGNTVEHVSLFRAERTEDEKTVFKAAGVVPHFVKLLDAQGITLSAKSFEA